MNAKLNTIIAEWFELITVFSPELRRAWVFYSNQFNVQKNYTIYKWSKGEKIWYIKRKRKNESLRWLRAQWEQMNNVKHFQLSEPYTGRVKTTQKNNNVERVREWIRKKIMCVFAYVRMRAQLSKKCVWIMLI